MRTSLHRRFLRFVILALINAIAITMMMRAAPAQSISPGLPLVPMGYCQLSAAKLATSSGLSECVRATFTGTGSGTTLTASTVSGIIQPGDEIIGSGVPAGTKIVKQLTGTTGGAGTYQTSVATTSSGAGLTSGGIPVDAQGRIANYMVLNAEAQAVRWRDDGAAPTATIGNSLPVAAPFTYSGPPAAPRFIQQTAGAILNISFYRSP